MKNSFIKHFTRKVFLKFSRKLFSHTESAPKIVKIKYEDLTNKNNHSKLFKNIEEAYGRDGLGLLVVQNVPNYLEYKNRLFKLAHKLVNLPDGTLKKLERPELNYGLGWSYGKEYLGEKPDLLKASYYLQLLNEVEKSPKDNNIWPQEIPELKQGFYELGGLLRQTGYHLLNVIDSYIKSVYPSYNHDYKELIRASKVNTGRILYYYPKKKFEGQDKSLYDADNWCEWHNDHGSLTGLCSAAYYDEKGNEVTDLKLTKTGLWIQDRKGKMIRAAYAKDELAFQVGETLQIHSGGILHATPHAVKVMDDIPDDLARVTFALFMEPNFEVGLNYPKESRYENITTSDIYSVPKIQKRFKDGMNFGQFNDATMSYYSKSEK
jgi:isopenicillin N synthase-like dioxygenase